MSAPAARRRLTPLKAIGGTLAYLLLGFVLSLSIATLGGYLTGGFTAQGVTSLATPSTRTLLLQGVATLLGFGIATWSVGIRGFGLAPEALRWRGVGPRLRGFGLGLVLGSAAAAVTIGLAVVLGGARFLPDAGTLGDYARRVGLVALLLAPAALGEEVMFRGVPQVLLAPFLGRGGAVVLISVLFGLAHLLNPGPTALALGNIALAGVFLGAAFYCPGGLATAWGAHLGWNATLVAVDAPVSGFELQIPYLNYDPGGPVWLTGQHFGPEGGLLATVALTAATVVAALWARRERA